MEAVSIHAPAWGATCRAILRAIAEAVSIHAPAWGATEIGRAIESEDIVSIHAPAWGATLTLEHRAFSETHIQRL